MNNKTLGTLALIGAPFLFIGMQLEEVYKQELAYSWFTGAWELIYITAWLASIVALQRMKAAGTSRFGQGILWVIIGTLLLAEASNIYLLLFPKERTTLFWILDTFWPISNLIMILVGIAVVRAKVLPGWHRFVPLVVGLWFPVSMLVITLWGRSQGTFLIGSIYSAIAWSLLAIVVLLTRDRHTVPCSPENTLEFPKI
ncbi:hypothetical protein [Adhaeribacter pallidiroseus]|uniref:Uncharacterized protein n=1 Tax=Adhaeribacter pallidiroseus TaxID=2072847 RepID=A0A369QU69_9BACT|nr:hypothetical protein [Adhaeribacter pallidiroseus]RDC66349.1 hypothetical protein AHMF7616_04980 [Adhaeribacter pallidiroseus]